MQIVMLYRPEVDDTGEPFEGIEVVKILDDSVPALEFIESFEASAELQADIAKWKWHIEPFKGSYLPPDLSEDLAHPYKG